MRSREIKADRHPLEQAGVRPGNATCRSIDRVHERERERGRALHGPCQQSAMQGSYRINPCTRPLDQGRLCKCCALARSMPRVRLHVLCQVWPLASRPETRTEGGACDRAPTGEGPHYFDLPATRNIFLLHAPAARFPDPHHQIIKSPPTAGSQGLRLTVATNPYIIAVQGER